MTSPLTLDLITGAKPSTTLRIRVTRTGKQAPIRVTYTTPDGSSADDGEVTLENGTQAQTRNAPGAQAQGGNATGKDTNSAFEARIPAADANRADTSGAGDSGSVWADRCEAKQAEGVYELELCVSMPEKEEWLKAQASINLTVPVLHFLMNNPPPGTEGIPEEQRTERQRSGNDPGSDVPGPEQQDFGRYETEDRQSGRIHESRKQSTEEQALENQGSSAPSGVGPGHGEQLFNDQGSGVPPGASEPAGAGSEFDFGLPVRVDPGARAPVMMNGRVPLDARTADSVVSQVKWLYRMFTDPETGVVLESTPTKYYIPAALKRMVEARHPYCSVPWCAVPARVCEKDHIEPFNHEDPESGGLTVMENLHPLCKRHHQEKTQKRLRVDRMDDGSLACVFPRIGAMLVYPPESRINQHQYERLIEYFDTGDQDISHTINNYQPTRHETAHRPDPAPAQVAKEVFNGDTRPWEPSNEPPPF